MAGVPKVQHPYSAGSIAGTGDIKSRWWKEEKGKVHQSIFPIVKRIKTNQTHRHTNHLLYARLYGNKEYMGLRPGQFSRIAHPHAAHENRVTLNVIKSCVDTAASKMAKAKTRPIFLTQGGNWPKKQQAKKLTKFMDGWFDHEKVYLKGQRMFVDAGVWGTGAVKLYKHEKSVKVERALLSELYIDDAEGCYGEPRQMHQVKSYQRDVLAELFPDHKEVIYNASSWLDEKRLEDGQGDMLDVIESWHLPSGENAGDGLHVITLDNVDLFSETWDKSYFPFVFFRWSEALLGFDGEGIAEELIGIQFEINSYLRRIARAHHLVCVPQVWLQWFDNAQNMAKINNEIGGKYYYHGAPPVFATPPGMPPEVFNHLWQLYQKAYEIVGISQMSANQKKPSGVTADVALRTLQDVESERFMLAVDRFEDCYMQIADIAIDMMNDLAKDGINPKVSADNKKFIESIDWKSVAMSKQDYVMRKFPMSALPNTPHGRIQAVQEWTQAGWISPEDAMELLDFPDTEKMISIKTAAKQVNEMVIDGILDSGKYTPPEPQMNLEMARAMAQNAYLRARMDGAPEDRLELIQNFMDDCTELIERAMGQNAQAPAQITEAAQPLAVPEAAPTSELMPMVDPAMAM